MSEDISLVALGHTILTVTTPDETFHLEVTPAPRINLDIVGGPPGGQGPQGERGLRGEQGIQGETGAGAEDPGDITLIFDNRLI